MVQKAQTKTPTVTNAQLVSIKQSFSGQSVRRQAPHMAQNWDSEGRETATRVKNTVKTAVTKNSVISFLPGWLLMDPR
jgi:hypothetical protein